MPLGKLQKGLHLCAGLPVGAAQPAPQAAFTRETAPKAPGGRCRTMCCFSCEIELGAGALQ
jgi:hypothetical protein